MEAAASQQQQWCMILVVNARWKQQWWWKYIGNGHGDHSVVHQTNSEKGDKIITFPMIKNIPHMQDKAT